MADKTSEHRLIIWEPTILKQVYEYQGNDEWEPSYVGGGRDFNRQFNCSCGESFHADEGAAREHVKTEAGS